MRDNISYFDSIIKQTKNESDLFYLISDIFDCTALATHLFRKYNNNDVTAPDIKELINISQYFTFSYKFFLINHPDIVVKPLHQVYSSYTKYNYIYHLHQISFHSDNLTKVFQSNPTPNTIYKIECARYTQDERGQIIKGESENEKIIQTLDSNSIFMNERNSDISKTIDLIYSRKTIDFSSYSTYYRSSKPKSPHTHIARASMIYKHLSKMLYSASEQKLSKNVLYKLFSGYIDLNVKLPVLKSFNKYFNEQKDDDFTISGAEINELFLNYVFARTRKIYKLSRIEDVNYKYSLGLALYRFLVIFNNLKIPDDMRITFTNSEIYNYELTLRTVENNLIAVNKHDFLSHHIFHDLGLTSEWVWRFEKLNDQLTLVKKNNPDIKLKRLESLIFQFLLMY